MSIQPQRLSFALVLTIFIVTSESATVAQRYQWWESQHFQKELALTPDQISRLSSISKSLSPALRAQKRAVDTLEGTFSTLFAEARVNEEEFEAFVERVEAERALLNKRRAIQLYRIRRVLSASQYAKLKELHAEERSKDNRSKEKPRP